MNRQQTLQESSLCVGWMRGELVYDIPSLSSFGAFFRGCWVGRSFGTWQHSSFLFPKEMKALNLGTRYMTRPLEYAFVIG